MAYSTSVPPMLISVAPLAAAGQIWRYATTDAGTAVDAAGYFTNAKALGMRAGDVVINYCTTTGLSTMHSVVTVTSTGADLGDGTTIASTSNSD